MKTLNDIKNELKLLLPEGIDVAIPAIKAVLAEGTDKYNDLLLLEGRYQDVSRQLIQGVIGDEAALVQFNKIRKDLLDFIDSLVEHHLATAEKKGVDGQPDIYNGEVLYRIPKQMQKEEETKCLVRLAFDRSVITQGLEKQEGDVMKDLRISEVMGVELLDPVGNAFQIRTLHDTVQFVDQDLFTEWIFFVKPVAEGIHDLVLKISIIEIKNGIERKRNVVLEEKVEIVATVPEKTGLSEEFARAGIAMAVAAGQKTKGASGGGTKEFFPPQPMPAAPSPAPAKTGTSFRKLGTILSAMTVLLVAAFAIFNTLNPDQNPGDTKVVDNAEQRSWDQLKNNPDPASIKDFLEKHPDGQLAGKARNSLDSLDKLAWESALAANDLAAMRNYLEKFPEGRYADAATSAIISLEHNLETQPVPANPERTNPRRPNTNRQTTPSTNRTNTPSTAPTDNRTNRDGNNEPTTPTPPEDNPNEVISMTSASRLPIYPGCKNEVQEKERNCTNRSISRYIKNNLNYPDRAKRQRIEGTVTVEFIIEKDGSVTGAQYKNDIGGGCGEEAVRLVQRLPRFEPGLNRQGQPARIRYILPIRFELR